jgi:hypothetical protein
MGSSGRDNGERGAAILTQSQSTQKAEETRRRWQMTRRTARGGRRRRRPKAAIQPRGRGGGTPREWEAWTRELSWLSGPPAPRKFAKITKQAKDIEMNRKNKQMETKKTETEEKQTLNNYNHY